MAKRTSRIGPREGYDLWAESYDSTSNPLVSLDRRHTLSALKPGPGEWILDAGCGTGAHLHAILGARGRPLGLDASRGMLRMARRNLPDAALVQADLDRELPIRGGTMDAFLSALVSEHLTKLDLFFSEAFAVLRPGGRLVFSAFHPELVMAGVEANFERDGIEYRLGAERHTVDDYLCRIADAGFRELRVREHLGDERLLEEVPWAGRYRGRPLLLLIEAARPRQRAA